MRADPRKITEFALRLKNADPHIYDKFIEHVAAYVHDITVAVTEAPPSEILVAQGRAQNAMKFYRLLTEFRDPAAKPTP